jgi:uncharacterized protein (DUF427 family)
MSKIIKVPDHSHPITIERNPLRVVVTAGGTIIADTHDALTLREARYPAVLYIPQKDHATYCPYKGDCAYYSIPSAGERGTNAVWTYEHPYEAVQAIQAHLAFYPDRVDSITELPVDVAKF